MHFGAVAKGKASRTCRAVHSAVGCAVTLKCTSRRRSCWMTIKTKRTWKSAVGTVKKSMETSCFEWFFRNVRQVCDGGFGCRTMYLLTEDSEIWSPSLRNSLWILGAPQPKLSRLRVRMRSRVSFGTRGRPGCPWRTFQVQYQRKPRRCPIDHGIRFHDPECLTPSGPELRRTDSETSISRFQ